MTSPTPPTTSSTVSPSSSTTLPVRSLAVGGAGGGASGEATGGGGGRRRGRRRLHDRRRRRLDAPRLRRRRARRRRRALARDAGRQRACGRRVGEQRRRRDERDVATVRRSRARRLRDELLCGRDLRAGHELAERAQPTDAAGLGQDDRECRDDRHGHERGDEPCPEKLADPPADEIHPIDHRSRRGRCTAATGAARVSPRRRSIARTLRVALLGLAIVLAVIGAIGIAALYDARQQYEDSLSATSALEVAAANLLTAAVALEANLARPRSSATQPFVARAARELDLQGGRVRVLARDDPPSRRLSRRISGARLRGAQARARPSAGARPARARRRSCPSCAAPPHSSRCARACSAMTRARRRGGARARRSARSCSARGSR